MAITHGCSRRGKTTVEYRIWDGIKQRCYSPGNSNWHKYGAKGIVMCDRWRNSFAAFLDDMGPRPSEKHSIDRYPNQTGNYEPGNCRWATPQEQANNVRTNSLVTHAGRTQSVAMWATEVGIKANTLLYRLRRGMPPARALQQRPVFLSTARAASRKRACAVCGVIFIPRPAQLAAGAGIFCSQACNGMARRKK